MQVTDVLQMRRLYTGSSCSSATPIASDPISCNHLSSSNSMLAGTRPSLLHAIPVRKVAVFSISLPHPNLCVVFLFHQKGRELCTFLNTNRTSKVLWVSLKTSYIADHQNDNLYVACVTFPSTDQLRMSMHHRGI